MADTRPIAFRPLRAEDVALMFAWRQEEHVSRWWHSASYDEVAAECAELIAGEEPVTPLIILWGERPIGYAQWYRLWNDGVVITPSYARLSPTIPRGAAAIDLFIGAADCLYRGLGPAILRALLRERIFAEPDIPGCVISPHPENASGIRAYEKAGFRYHRTIWMEETAEEEYVMYLAREEFGED
jgi:RimJ/RimL family protein N-acetyltransferase